MRIVNISEYKTRRKKSMYEGLVEKLTNHPASSCTVQEAENLADSVLKNSGLDRLIGSTPIVAIAQGFGIRTYKEINLPEEISGNLYVGGTTAEIYGTDKVIIVGEEEEYFHQRFIIAHELAHYLIDYLGSSESKNTRILFSRTYPKRNHESAEEVRADRFAAELLMPSRLFLGQYINAMRVSGNNRRYTISYLSDYFETKKTSIEKRIKEVI